MELHLISWASEGPDTATSGPPAHEAAAFEEPAAQAASDGDGRISIDATGTSQIAQEPRGAAATNLGGQPPCMPLRPHLVPQPRTLPQLLLVDTMQVPDVPLSGVRGPVGDVTQVERGGAPPEGVSDATECVNSGPQRWDGAPASRGASVWGRAEACHQRAAAAAAASLAASALSPGGAAAEVYLEQLLRRFRVCFMQPGIDAELQAGGAALHLAGLRIVKNLRQLQASFAAPADGSEAPSAAASDASATRNAAHDPGEQLALRGVRRGIFSASVHQEQPTAALCPGTVPAASVLDGQVVTGLSRGSYHVPSGGGVGVQSGEGGGGAVAAMARQSEGGQGVCANSTRSEEGRDVPPSAPLLGQPGRSRLGIGEDGRLDKGGSFESLWLQVCLSPDLL